MTQKLNYIKQNNQKESRCEHKNKQVQEKTTMKNYHKHQLFLCFSTVIFFLYCMFRHLYKTQLSLKTQGRVLVKQKQYD